MFHYFLFCLRLNWPIEHSCQIEEYVNHDGASGSVWDVMDGELE